MNVTNGKQRGSKTDLSRARARVGLKGALTKVYTWINEVLQVAVWQSDKVEPSRSDLGIGVEDLGLRTAQN